MVKVVLLEKPCLKLFRCSKSEGFSEPVPRARPFLNEETWAAAWPLLASALRPTTMKAAREAPVGKSSDILRCGRVHARYEAQDHGPHCSEKRRPSRKVGGNRPIRTGPDVALPLPQLKIR